MSKVYLVGVDDYIWSLHAFNTAKCFITRDKSFGVTDKLYILHVSLPSVSGVMKGMVSEKTQQSIEESAELTARKILTYYYENSFDLQMLGIEIIFLRGSGSKVHEIVNRAVDLFSVDQVVVGKGESGLVKKYWIGSVSKSIMETCKASVMVVKKPHWLKHEITEEQLKDSISDSRPDVLFTSEMITHSHPFARYTAHENQRLEMLEKKFNEENPQWRSIGGFKEIKPQGGANEADLGKLEAQVACMLAATSTFSVKET